ncbi:MAG: beta-N-acetylhexosaminidase [Gammaproteobacteria bacterium]|nr:beta-N-acetylhexosaminidase [Gammaproteobacteria bacterium]
MIFGNVMLDVAGVELTAEDAKRLAHPACGGVILFSRNYDNPQQLAALVSSIRASSPTPLLISVDHEGGRVQRFHNGFTSLPPMAWLGQCYDQDAWKALQQARELGWLMAAECRMVDIDFSFAPVLDLGLGVCEVIGNRAFHADPEVVFLLAAAWMHGMHDAGMAAVGKHFPGHGAVTEDSHLDLPVDRRDIDVIMKNDVRPYVSMFSEGLEAVMPAHVIYQQADQHAAGFSHFWLQQVLRDQLKFGGVIFSDDLSMAAAASAGSYATRALAAVDAGCDMVLICNQPQAADEILQAMREYHTDESQRRLQTMVAKQSSGLAGQLSGKRGSKAVKLADEGVTAIAMEKTA